MLLKRSDLDQVVKLKGKKTNFLVKELYCGSFNAPDEHHINDCLIEAIQFIREKTSSPTYINGNGLTGRSARTKLHQMYLNPLVPNGLHVLDGQNCSHAIDFSIKDKALLEVIKEDIYNKGEYFKALWKIGIRGFGLYDWGIHLDDGVNRSENKKGAQYNGVKYSIWDKRKKKRLSLPDTDDGILQFSKTELIVSSLVVFIILRKIFR